MSCIFPEGCGCKHHSRGTEEHHYAKCTASCFCSCMEMGRPLKDIPHEETPHGTEISCRMAGETINRAKITIEETRRYVCQDVKDGSYCEDKQGFKYSWVEDDKVIDVIIRKPKGGEKTMSLSTIAEQELSEENKELIHEGYLNSDLSISSKGVEKAQDYYFLSVKSELAKQAKSERIEREKQEKLKK